MQAVSFHLMPIMIVFSAAILWFIGARGVTQILSSPMGASIMSSKQAVIISAVFGVAGVMLSGHIVSNTYENIVFLNASADPVTIARTLIVFVATTFIWMFFAARGGALFSFSYTVVCSLVASFLFGIGYDAINRMLVVKIMVVWLISPFVCYLLTLFVNRLFQSMILQQENPVVSVLKKGPWAVFSFVTVFGVIIFYGGISFLPEQYPTYLGVAVPCLFGAVFYILSLVSIKDVAPPTSDDAILAESTAEGIVRKLALLVVFVLPFSLGANNIANGIGPLFLGLKAGLLTMPGKTQNPLGWLLLFGGGVFVLGLLSSGLHHMQGMSRKFTELTPVRSFSIIVAASLTIMIATSFGIPLSTFHTVAGGVLAFSHITASSQKTAKIEVGKFLGGYLLPWFFTIPGTFLIAGALHMVVRVF